MTLRVLSAAAFLAAALAAGGAGEAEAQEEKQGPMKLIVGEGGSVSWEDQSGETTYEVSGSAIYFPPASCAPDRLALGTETVEFSERLPANATRFSIPLPADSRLTWRKDLQVTVDALDAAGQMLVRDGLAYQADKFCTADELAAAGTGVSHQPTWPWAAVAGLAIAGAALMSAAVFAQKKT